ncbi:alpha-(1-_3)-arabinofuranosyltransferase domain-containing protein [Streptomyces sp. INA 01156]
MLVLPGLMWPYLNGSILGPGSFREIPTYWQATADWLEEHSPTPGPRRAGDRARHPHLGLDHRPAAGRGRRLRWAQRDYVPFGTPGNRRAMDAVEQALLTGAEVPDLPTT